MENTKLKSTFIILIVILVVLCTGVYVSKHNEEVAQNDITNSQEKFIFEVNLPDINSKLGNNLTISANKVGDTYKSIIINIIKEGEIQEIKNSEIENTLISTYEDELQYNKSDYFVIRALELKNDPDIGVVHSTLNERDYKNSSGYILDEQSVSKKKNLCISTSSVYNNWACFVYDKEKNNFVLSYAQNFAD